MSVTTQSGVSFGNPVRAPKAGFVTFAPVGVRSYDILPDGKRFVGVVPYGDSPSGAPGAPQIRVVLNWFEEVKQRAKGK